MTEPEGVPEVRERGWRGPILATLALLILPGTPMLRLLLPVDQTLLLLAPALAVCAVAGWRAGGRIPVALFWTAFAAWILWQPGNDAPGAFSLLARGWGAMLAAAFGAVLLVRTGERFLPRALLTLGVALVLGAAVAAVSAGSLRAAWEIVATELAGRADLARQQWTEVTGSDGWTELLRDSPETARAVSDEVDRQLVSLPEAGRVLFPALLLLESLAALALAWAVYHRVGRARLGPPLARLRDLRFHDALVWGVVAGLLLMVLPLSGLARGIGVNLLVFFGALYALRGLGVIIWFLAPGRWMAVFLTLFALFFGNVVGVVAVGVGLGDTWFDWRRRGRPTTQRSE